MLRKFDLTELALVVAFLGLFALAVSQRVAADFYNGLEHPARPSSPTPPLPF